MALPAASRKPSQAVISGSESPSPMPGDFMLTHGTAWTSRLIRFGERARYRGANSRFAHWSHAVAVVGADGAIVEALGGGVAAGHLSKYAGTEYAYVRVVASGEDRAEMAAFARSQVGARYGFLTILSLALGLLTSGRVTFGLSGTEICSGLVARMLERGAYSWVDPPSVMPADLARFFDVPGS